MNTESEYTALLTKFIIKFGTLVMTGSQAYGWIAEDYSEGIKHIRQCGFDVDKLEEEYDWSEFAGTFADHDDHKTGMQMTVTCTCGAYAKRAIRWDGRVAEAIRGVLELRSYIK